MRKLHLVTAACAISTIMLSGSVLAQATAPAAAQTGGTPRQPA